MHACDRSSIIFRFFSSKLLIDRADHLLSDDLVFFPGCVPRHPLEEVTLVTFHVNLSAFRADFGLERVPLHLLMEDKVTSVRIKGRAGVGIARLH